MALKSFAEEYFLELLSDTHSELLVDLVDTPPLLPEGWKTIPPEGPTSAHLWQVLYVFSVDLL